MTKRFWSGVMVFSLFVTMASGSFLYMSLQEHATMEVPLTKREPVEKKEQKEEAPAPKKQAEQNEESAVKTSTTSSKEVAELPGLKEDKAKKDKTPLVGTRNILFTLFSSKAKKVHIIGDFNNWYREPLNKKGKKVWSKAILLEPGTYKYMYVVDGRRIRDPNTKKVSKDGKSLITVKPLN